MKFLIFAALIFGSQAQANLPNAPEVPLDHCYHWIKEANYGYLSFKYKHAEVTGGEFTFQTSQGGHMAGDGIYCAKTLVGSIGYGDRVIRIDFSEDTVFRSMSGQNVCSTEVSSQDCRSRTPDVVSYHTGNGWYVIKNPDSILSWTSSSDQLREDINTFQSSVRRYSELTSVLQRMDTELQTRPKQTYFNPKARKGLLKLLNENENFIVQMASVLTIQSIMNFKSTDITPERRQAVLQLAIATLKQKSKYRELLAVHALFKADPQMQNLVVESIRETMTPEVIATLDLSAMAELDALVPDKFDESTLQKAFANSVKASQDLDFLIASASKSPKLQPVLDSFEFTEAMVRRFTNRESIVLAFKNTIRKGNIEAQTGIVTYALSRLANSAKAVDFVNEVSDYGLFSDENTPALAKILFGESQGFNVLAENVLLELVVRWSSRISPQLFVQSVSAAVSSSPHWLQLTELFTRTPPLQPFLMTLLPSRQDEIKQLKLDDATAHKLFGIAQIFTARASKLKPNDVGYFKTVLNSLLQDSFCRGGLPLNYALLEPFKSDKVTYATLVTSFVTDGMAKKDAGLLSKECAPTVVGYTFSLLEKHLPPPLKMRFWSYFDAIKYPVDADAQTSPMAYPLIAKELPKFPILEWKLMEKALDQRMALCAKDENLDCRFAFWMNNIFRSYSDLRYGSLDEKNYATSRFVSRVTEYFVKRNLPALAWISFRYESYYFQNPKLSGNAMKPYFELYASKTATSDFKKRFEYLFENSLESEFTDFIARYLNDRAAQQTPELHKAASILFGKLGSSIMQKRFGAIADRASYKNLMRMLINPNRSYNSKTVYCDYLDYSVRTYAGSLALFSGHALADLNNVVEAERKKSCQ